MKSLVLFNNKGGVGKTTLTFHLAHMMARFGLRVVVLDYDPQCNLTSFMLDEDKVTELWQQSFAEGSHVAACVDLVRRGKGDVVSPRLQEIADNLWLLPGHLHLSRFEQTIAGEWPKVFATDNERALDVTTALDLLSNLAAEKINADVIIFDIGPNLGALNHSVLIACDAVVVPLAPDLFSLQGLENVGPTLREWRADWQNVCANRLTDRPQESYPRHAFEPIGYLVQQHIQRIDRPLRAYQYWADKIPDSYRKNVLNTTPNSHELTIEDDPNCIATIKHFAGLVPLAHEKRKPMFDLKKADGVSGGGLISLKDCLGVFQQMAREILSRLSVDLPS